MVRQERSAGFVIFCEDKAGREFLLLDYGRHWDFPKGHVEAGEDDMTAARRELFEETAISDPVVIAGFSREITYFFRHRKHGLVRKTVMFFLARARAREITLSDEHSAFTFLPYEKALKKITFPTARQVLIEANAFLTPPSTQT